MLKISLIRKSRIGWLKLLRETSGSQLLEFALALPFLAVIAIGVLDFGQAYNVKQKLTNAAREAARITVSNPLTNILCAGPPKPPCSIQAAADASKQYMMNAGLSAASCIAPDAPNSPGSLTWTYSCDGITLTINRGYVFTNTNGFVVESTQVTLSYPYTWKFGSVIGLLEPGSTITLPSTLTTSVVMRNLVNG